jgi:hypothetical protein
MKAGLAGGLSTGLIEQLGRPDNEDNRQSHYRDRESYSAPFGRNQSVRECAFVSLRVDSRIVAFGTTIMRSTKSH